jgi:predicted ester cyclase
MSVEQNKATIRRIVEELINQGKWSVLPELVSPNYVVHSDPEVRGPEGFRQMFSSYKENFPDFQASFENLVAEGDFVAHFLKFTGTFQKEYMGVAPTGKKFTITIATLSRFEGGKEVEAWQYMDRLATYQQMGISVPQN